jgi:hypothetical protein
MHRERLEYGLLYITITEEELRAISVGYVDNPGLEVFKIHPGERCKVWLTFLGAE